MRFFLLHFSKVSKLRFSCNSLFTVKNKFFFQHLLFFQIAKCLTELVNANLVLSEADIVAESLLNTGQRNHFSRTHADKLIGYAGNMNLHLTSLLVENYLILNRSSKIYYCSHESVFFQAIIQNNETEKERLRKELQQTRDQVDILLSQNTKYRFKKLIKLDEIRRSW